MELHPAALLFQLLASLLDKVGYKVPQIGGLGTEGEVPCLQAGEIEQPLEQHQRQRAANPLDGQPGAIHGAAIDENPFFDNMERHFPGPAHKGKGEKEQD